MGMMLCIKVASWRWGPCSAVQRIGADRRTAIRRWTSSAVISALSTSGLHLVEILHHFVRDDKFIFHHFPLTNLVQNDFLVRVKLRKLGRTWPWRHWW